MWKFVAFFSVLVVTLGFGLWPLDFDPANDVQFDGGERALSFAQSASGAPEESRGIAFSESVFDASAWQEISILMEVRGAPRAGGLGVILELLDESSADHAPIKIAQWKEHLSIRSGRSSTTKARGYSEIGYRDCFSGEEFVTVLIASGPRGTQVYCGSDSRFTKGFPLLTSEVPFRGRLVLGNNPDGTQPFQGAIRRLEIYSQVISPGTVSRGLASPVESFDFGKYQTSGDRVVSVVSQGWLTLRVPDRFEPLERVFLRPISLARMDERPFQKDALLNYFGFFPLGVMAVAVGRSRRGKERGALVAALALALCFSTSFAIEWTQGYLVERDSSQLDLALNTLGGAMAALLAQRFWRKPYRAQTI